MGLAKPRLGLSNLILNIRRVYQGLSNPDWAYVKSYLVCAWAGPGLRKRATRRGSERERERESERERTRAREGKGKRGTVCERGRGRKREGAEGESKKRDEGERRAFTVR